MGKEAVGPVGEPIFIPRRVADLFPGNRVQATIATLAGHLYAYANPDAPLTHGLGVLLAAFVEKISSGPVHSGLIIGQWGGRYYAVVVNLAGIRGAYQVYKGEVTEKVAGYMNEVFMVSWAEVTREEAERVTRWVESREGEKSARSFSDAPPYLRPLIWAGATSAVRVEMTGSPLGMLEVVGRGGALEGAIGKLLERVMHEEEGGDEPKIKA